MSSAFRAPGPAVTNSSLPQQLKLWAQATPHAIAMTAPGREPLTYRRMYKHLEETGARLRGLGINGDDRVAMVLPDGPEMAVAFVAVASCAQSAPLNPGFRSNEFKFYLQDLGVKALMVKQGIDSPAIQVARELKLPIIELQPLKDDQAGLFRLQSDQTPSNQALEFNGADDVALVLHTSGTTSRPKLVPLTQRNVCISAHNIVTSLQLTAEDRCLNVMPLFHIHGLVGCVLAPLVSGGSVLCTPGFQGARFFDWTVSCKPTWYTASPSIHQAVLAQAKKNPEIVAGRPFRFIRSAAAPLSLTVLTDMEQTFGVPLIESYGMTETAKQIASNPLPPHPRKPGSVGIAAGPEIAIMDVDDSLLGANQTGEIVVRGKNVMAGYENNAAANSEAFSGGWFRTGDQGHLDTDGYLYISGRLKEIINQGGEKISPREIDEVLMAHADIDQAVAFAIPNSRLGEEIAAAVVLRPPSTLSPTDVQAFAASRLADFKVPRLVVIVDQLPKSAVGKFQRIGLAEKLGITREISDADNPGEFVPPRNETEAALADIWGAVLAIDTIGVHDDFFQQGGDSLSATQVITRIREELGVEVPYFVFFASPDIEALANYLSLNAHTKTTVVNIPRASRDVELPLSFAQQRLWFLHYLEEGNPAYNVSLNLAVHGPLDVSALKRSLLEIVRRHEVIRTTYPAREGIPFQRIHPPPDDLSIPMEEISGRSEGDQQEQIEAIGIRESGIRFDLEHGPLLRVALLKCSDHSHVLLLNMPHIMADGWSVNIFHEELITLYEAFTDEKLNGLPNALPNGLPNALPNGLPNALPNALPNGLSDPLPIQYADYTIWQRDWLNANRTEQLISYWRAQLADAPMLELPTDYSRPPIATFRGARHTFTLPRALHEKLKELSQAEGCTQFMTMLTAFAVLLYRYSGQADLVIGTPIANRERTEIESLVGCFINMLVLRVDMAGNADFRTLLARVRKTALDAYQHQDLPFERLVNALQPPRDLSRSAFMQVQFIYQNTPGPAVVESSSITFNRLHLNRDSSQLDLSLYLWETADDLTIQLEYSTALFLPDTIKRFAEHYGVLLDGIVAHPECPIVKLPLMSDMEQHKLLHEWNDTARVYPQTKSVCQLFEEQVLRTPQAIAAQYLDHCLTYQELNKRANHLADELRSAGAGVGSLVGIHLRRSLHLPVALIGALKAGAAYVPLDPTYPEERLAYMISDCGLSIVLSEDGLPQLPANHLRVINLDRHEETVHGLEFDNPNVRTGPDDLAYVIYTSGSTGRPKGVQARHGSLTNFLISMQDRPGIGTEDVLLAVTTISFDIAGLELFLPLISGARVVIADDDAVADGSRLGKLIDTSKTTMMQATPATWQMLLTAGWSGSLHLKVLCGGEALPAAMANQLRSRSASLWNLYGPTETTIWSTLMEVSVDYDDAVPIGRPLANTQAYVLDEHRQPVPVGVPGELYIGGDGVSPGYINQPLLTGRQFVADPFAGRPESRIYRTGDRVRYRPDGMLMFLGRLDNQIKLRGFRIEPAEIEAAMQALPEVQQTVVEVYHEKAGDKRLVAYIVPNDNQEILPMALRRQVAACLPSYMVPQFFVNLESLPLTPNGKVDRKALPSPFQTQAPTEEAAQPISPAERAVAEIWQELLGLEFVGRNENFFELGGHSLLAIQAIAQMEAKSGVRLNPREMVLGTLQQVAAELQSQNAELPSSSTGTKKGILRKVRRWLSS